MQTFETRLSFRADPAHEIFAIGDVHGRLDLLEPALAEIARIQRDRDKTSIVVFLGDLIDRGPDSLACIDAAMDAARQAKVVRAVYLRGNHEQMLAFGLLSTPVDAVRLKANGIPLPEQDALIAWYCNGGDKVVGLVQIEELPGIIGPKRRTWLDGLEAMFFSGAIAFVHAGLPPQRSLAELLATPVNIPLADIVEDDHWAWVGDPFLRHAPGPSGHHGYFVFHGHTVPAHDPIAYPQEQIKCGRVNLDGGSFATGVLRFAHLRDDMLALYEVTPLSTAATAAQLLDLEGVGKP